MPRLVKHTATGPAVVKTKSGDSVSICRCGLTDNEDGTCSSNHKKFKVAEEDPNEVYKYDEDGRRHKLDDDCCEDKCCDEDEKKESSCCSGCGGCCRDED